MIFFMGFAPKSLKNPYLSSWFLVIFWMILFQNLSKILTSAHDFLGILLQNILKILTSPHDFFWWVLLQNLSKILTSAHDFLVAFAPKYLKNPYPSSWFFRDFVPKYLKNPYPSSWFLMISLRGFCSNISQKS